MRAHRALCPRNLAQVLRLPPGARPLAGSPTATYEFWAVGDSVLAFQVSHEEGRVDRWVRGCKAWLA